jgi:RNA ligase (TIGR02306 family)
MSFEVKVRQIDVLEPHPNADRLELVVIGGYRAVVQKGIHTVGDRIVYVPEDTVFKNLEVAEKLLIASYLTGKHKNRVKSIKLRGILSQGIVLPMSAFEEADIKVEIAPQIFVRFRPLKPVMVETDTGELSDTGTFEPATSDEIIQFLELEKYEEPIPVEMAGQVRRWPSFVPKYEVENIKRPESLNVIQVGEEVVATEKLHGTNMTVAIGPGLDEGEIAFVCSRNNALTESETNVYWRAARKYELIMRIKFHMDAMNALLDEPGIESISLHGEVVGVQDLKYGFGIVNNDIGFFAFDVMINGTFLSHDQFVEFCTNMNIPMVPVLYRGPYDYKTLDDVAHGRTSLGGGHIREGVVVKPVKEREDGYGNRVNFKFISEDYLTRKGGTEMH